VGELPPTKILSQEDIDTWVNDQKIDWQNDEDEVDVRNRDPVQLASGVEVPTSEYEDDNKPSKLCSRVARWHIFRPKISIWVHFGGP
jgi:endo-beta-N-acetylglucosaminidase D